MSLENHFQRRKIQNQIISSKHIKNICQIAIKHFSLFLPLLLFFFFFFFFFAFQLFPTQTCTLDPSFFLHAHAEAPALI